MQIKNAVDTAYPSLAAEALHGLAGDFVKAVEPNSEADKAALLLSFLTAFGNYIDRSCYFEIEADKHYTNLFITLVGNTAKARKGTSFSYIRKLFSYVDETYALENIKSGLSSGEGLAYHVRDEIARYNSKTNDYEIIDEGITDKRLLAYESEFASVLKAATRDGNILSATLRQAWESGNLRTLTKNNPVRATGAHISILAHITKEELLRYLNESEATNGFANRFLWACVKRSKLLPLGGSVNEEELKTIALKVRQAAAYAKRLAANSLNKLELSSEAEALWYRVYFELEEEKTSSSLVNAITQRLSTQALKLAVIYAVLDMSSTIELEHLQAALAVIEYCEQSAKYIFSELSGDVIADKIYQALLISESGLTKSEISRELFQRNIKKERIDLALASLIARDLIYSEKEETDGRSIERFKMKLEK